MNYIEKTREEQDEEIRNYFRPYADSNCKICLGVGHRGWMIELRQYIICECVMINVEKALILKKEQENKIEVIN